MPRPIVIVGAGAAGLMAALFARSTGRAVIVLERTADGGRKILISGGGRCNVLPSIPAPERFVTDSRPQAVARLLGSWPLAAQRRFFEDDLGVPLALEPETGKLFPASNRARDVRDGLVTAARRAGVDVRFGVSLAGVDPIADGWRVRTSDSIIDADAVVLATGGLSVPLTGSDGTGLRVAAALDIRVHATYPALTPLVAAPAVHAGLAGISLDVSVRAGSGKSAERSRGGFLFTHRGYSGPSILDVSHVAVRSLMSTGGAGGSDARSASGGAQEPDSRRSASGGAQDPDTGRFASGGTGKPDAALSASGGTPHPHAGRSAHGGRAPIRVQWCALDEAAWDAALAPGRGLVVTAIARHLPRRLADRLVEEGGLTLDRTTATLRRPDCLGLIARLVAYPLPWTGDEGYKKAEVTGGGVALEEMDLQTLECRRHPRLFVCGELLDAFGPIGGHNFAWAWATGRIAGLGAAASRASSGGRDAIES